MLIAEVGRETPVTAVDRADTNDRAVRPSPPEVVEGVTGRFGSGSAPAKSFSFLAVSGRTRAFVLKSFKRSLGDAKRASTTVRPATTFTPSTSSTFSIEAEAAGSPSGCSVLGV